MTKMREMMEQMREESAMERKERALERERGRERETQLSQLVRALAEKIDVHGGNFGTHTHTHTHTHVYTCPQTPEARLVQHPALPSAPQFDSPANIHTYIYLLSSRRTAASKQEQEKREVHGGEE